MEEIKNYQNSAWTSADCGDGTYRNPLIFADVPDLDIIRSVDKEGREAYYMVSTTMHMTPGVSVMKSYDLINWSIVNYVYAILEKEDRYALKNGQNDYAVGSWAASLRQDIETGWFFVAFTCNSSQKTYIFMTEDIEKGPWYRNEFSVMCYDNGLFFDGKTGIKYIFYSRDCEDGKATHDICYRKLFVDIESHNIRLGDEFIVLHNSNFENPKQGLWGEGLHVYFRNGYYYIFAIQGVEHRHHEFNWQRQEICWRSKDLNTTGRWDEMNTDGQPGAWTCRKIFVGDLEDEAGNTYMKSTGIAQGGIVDTASGKWYCFLFEDYGAVGRIPVMCPVEWGESGEDKDWPIIGNYYGTSNPNRHSSMNLSYPKPIDGCEITSIVYEDYFDNNIENYRPYDTQWGTKPVCGEGENDYHGSQMSLQWQWNHNPDNRFWSLTERPGYLRLRTVNVVESIRSARNIPTVRTFGPMSTANTVLEINGLTEGDFAGLCIFQNQYGYVGVTIEDGKKVLIMQKADHKDDAQGRCCQRIILPEDTEKVYLQIRADFRNKTDKAYFYYSLVEEKHVSEWITIGEVLQMEYDWPDFVGYRFGLFCYASKKIGGFADFNYFKVFGQNNEM